MLAIVPSLFFLLFFKQNPLPVTQCILEYIIPERGLNEYKKQNMSNNSLLIHTINIFKSDRICPPIEIAHLSPNELHIFIMNAILSLLDLLLLLLLYHTYEAMSD